MRIVTKRFGTHEIDPDKVIVFQDGLIGFPDEHRFAVMNFDVDEDWVRWLQALDDPDLGFLTMDPRAVFPEYDPEVCPNDLFSLQASPEDIILLCVVTVPQDVRKMTVNLRAPLLINPSNRRGRQVIVDSPEYTTKHYVFSALSKLAKRTG